MADRRDRSNKRRPFSTWMKKLANLKGGSSNDAYGSAKRNTYQMKSHSKKHGGSKNNNPYPESGVLNAGQLNGGPSSPTTNGHPSFSTVPTVQTGSSPRNSNSVRLSEDGLPPPTIGTKSTAATMSDNAHSEAAGSHAPSSGDATTGTAGAGRGADSTFSSPAPSVRSLTTTLTTIQSAVQPTASSTNNNSNVQFSHQFPISPPPSALPPHLAPQSSGGHPATYSTATANGLLTDNASILTLASSSKRRRRRSMDTDASVRALAPSSLFGGSRESLPLSVLSSTVETPGLHQPNRPSMQIPNERASIYSATGVAPALPSERNSYYAGKGMGDGGSVKSGLLGHGRNDSITGSIGAGAGTSSPLASPRDPTGLGMSSSVPGAQGKLSRNNSGWGEVEVDGDGDEDRPEEEEVNGELTETNGLRNGHQIDDMNGEFTETNGLQNGHQIDDMNGELTETDNLMNGHLSREENGTVSPIEIQQRA